METAAGAIADTGTAVGAGTVTTATMGTAPRTLTVATHTGDPRSHSPSGVDVIGADIATGADIASMGVAVVGRG